MSAWKEQAQRHLPRNYLTRRDSGSTAAINFMGGQIFGIRRDLFDLHLHHPCCWPPASEWRAPEIRTTAKRP